MNNDDLCRYASAYKQIVVISLGPKGLRQAASFERLLQIEQGLIRGYKNLSTVKLLLARSLIRLIRSTEFKHLHPYLTTWLQRIIAVSTPTQLGQFCVHLASILFPQVEKEEQCQGG